MIGTCGFTVSCALVLATAPVPPVYHGRLLQIDVSVPKITSAVNVDGRLDDADWQNAAILTGFSQFSPVDMLAADDSTEVLVMYTDNAIYFGIRAFETHGDVITSRSDRDRIGSDDNFDIFLDTFNDRRRALVFGANPFGIQRDGAYSDGGNIDLSPDFLYESKGRLTDYGYEVEVRIPFKSLPYQQTPVQSWGIQVVRRVQHSGQEHTWTQVERGKPSILSQSGTFVDLTNLKRGLVLDINPVVTSSVSGARVAPTDPAWQYKAQNPEFGGNVRWGVTPNLTMNATINPDFSQVEADVNQVIFDPRASVSFPEKRPFFLEGNENFAVNNSLIYTRRIADPVAAAKFSGKVGDLNVGILSAVDGEALSATPQEGTNPIFNILRLRRDLGAQSNVGFVYTDRVDGDFSNRVVGTDTRLLVAGKYVFNGQIASSFTQSAAGTSNWRPLWDFTFNRPGRDWSFNSSLEGVHPQFVAASGFTPRPGIAHANVSPRRTFFPENSTFQSFSTSTTIDMTWDYDRFQKGTFPNDFKWFLRFDGNLKGGWRLNLNTFLETFLYPAQLYTNYYIERRGTSGAVLDTVPYVGTHRLPNLGGTFSVNTPQFQKWSANASLTAGHDDNFDEWSSAWISFANVNIDWRPTSKIRVNGRYVEQRFHRVSDGSLVRLRTIPRVKLEYQVARPVFFRFVGQYDATKVDALRDDSRTNDPILFRNPVTGTFRRSVAQQRSGFRADWLFSYQPNPGTVLFAGYGTSLNGLEYFEPSELTRTSDGFFVKLSYLFRM